jgi:hypothetical protein
LLARAHQRVVYLQHTALGNSERNELQGASFMSTIKRFEIAPTQFQKVGDIRIAYREIGAASGVPVIFLNHLGRCWTIGIHAWWTVSPRSTA